MCLVGVEGVGGSFLVVAFLRPEWAVGQAVAQVGEVSHQGDGDLAVAVGAGAQQLEGLVLVDGVAGEEDVLLGGLRAGGGGQDRLAGGGASSEPVGFGGDLVQSEPRAAARRTAVRACSSPR